MRILLVNTNRATQPYPVMPIGMASVATALEHAGHEIKVLDLCFIPDYSSAIRKTLSEFHPELIGLSVRNLDNSDLIDFNWFLPEVREMVRAIRRESPAPIVVGGSAVSVMPVEVLEYLECDMGVIGDGEQAILELVKKIEESDPTLPETPGLVIKHNGSWRVNPKQPVLEYRLYGTTQLHRHVNVSQYLQKGSVFPIQSNRGCAFSCIYCTYTEIEGKKYRLRPEELVVQEIKEAEEHAGVSYFEFVDSVFNVPESHAKSVCQAIIDAGIKARFGAAGINPRWLTRELLDLMERAGFSSLDITIESASEIMLKNMNKGFRLADVLNAAKQVKNTPIKIMWVFLLGGPGETDKTLEESFDFVRNHVRPSDVVYITSGIRIYPNTPMAEIAIKNGMIQHPSELVRPTFYLSENIGFEEMRSKVIKLTETHPNVIASFDGDDPLLPAAYRIFDWLKVSHPYWQYAPFLNRIKQLRSRFFGNIQRIDLQDLIAQGSYYIQRKLA